MSLQIWLPLNGNINNQGLLGDAKITGTAGFTSTGKIGAKSMNSGTLALSAKDANKILNNDAFSYCCWIYVNADAETTAGCNAFFGRESMSSGGNRQFTMFQYSKVNNLYWSWQNDTTTDGSIIAGGGLNNVFPSKTWTHFAMAYKKGEYKFYTNGKCIYTGKVICNSLTYYYSLPIAVCSNARYLNDVRLYDHCLSPKEVNEIARGLVSHYKLDSSGVANINLLNNTYPNDSGWGINRNATEFTKTVYEDYTEFNVTSLDNSWFLYYHDLPTESRKKLKTNTKYIFSFEAKSNKAFNLDIRILNGNGTKPLTNSQRADILGDELWHKYYVTLTTIADFTNVIDSQYLYMSGGKLVSNVCYRKAKLEEGSGHTTWSPGINDILYTTLGYDSLNVEDSSGYSNNGNFINDIPSTDITSPRYEFGYNFANPKHLKITQPLVNPNELTVSFWVKPQSGCGSYAIISSNYNNPPSGFWIAINTENSPAWFYNGGYCKANGTLLTANTWYHLVLTSKDGKFIWYKNGEFFCEADLSSKSKTVAITNVISIGNSYTGNSWNTVFNGSISDFRIYCTALSANDVKDLYTTSASIGSDGKSYMHEYKEV